MSSSLRTVAILFVLRLRLRHRSCSQRPTFYVRQLMLEDGHRQIQDGLATCRAGPCQGVLGHVLILGLFVAGLGPSGPGTNAGWDPARPARNRTVGPRKSVPLTAKPFTRLDLQSPIAALAHRWSTFWRTRSSSPSTTCRRSCRTSKAVR